MKYFDILPASVMDELVKRGVSANKLLYCVRADLDGDGRYYDTYVTFDSESLHLICGYEVYEKPDRRTRKRNLPTFKFESYNSIALETIDKIYLDRGQYTARLMIKDNSGEEFPIARLSVGYAEKFEKFCARVILTKNGEEIDDSLLDDVKTYCDTCGEPYPDPNRPQCPKCVDRRSVFFRLMGMFSEFKFALFGMAASILLSGAFAVISPYFGTKLLYDDVLTDGGRFYGKIAMIVIVMASVSFAGMLLHIISGIIMSTITPKVMHSLRCKIFSSMQRLSLSFFTSKQTGTLMTRVDRDSQNVFWFFTDIVPYGLMNIVKLLGIVVVMFYLSPVLSLGIILTLIMLRVIISRFFKGQRKLYHRYDRMLRTSNGILSDAMNGQRVVKAFAKEDKEIKRFGDKNTELYRLDYQIFNNNANFIPLISNISRVINIIIYCMGAWMVVKGNLAFGALTALIAYTDLANEPIHFFTWIGDRWARCADAASRMFEILDGEPTVRESENPVRFEDMEGNIELKNVQFEYEAGRPIIKDVSLKVNAGQMFGIVGKTGAGKSTIINLIARLYDVTGGEISIDGVNIKEIATEDLRRNIGIVSQETYLFIGTVADNIRYARPDAPMEEVIEAAKSANAHEFITKLPDGYDTKIGEGAMSLSGGERQRISIARAIIQKPNILILDEATASMDTRTERKIQIAIDSLKEGRTIISIAHRLSTLRDADMLCVIENGELKEIGTHDELIRAKGKYYELHKLQADSLKFIGAN